MVPKTKARENLEELQGLIFSIVQRNPKIINDLEDQRIGSECASRTSQCGNFHQDSSGPNPGAGKSHNIDTIENNLGGAVDKGDLGALKPSC